MPDIRTIAGTWRLVSAKHASVPTSHYVEFVFSVEGERVRGAFNKRNADGQLPVDVVLDGSRLRVRIPPVPSTDAAETDAAERPWLVLAPVDDAFEGYWQWASGKRIEPAIALRLVRVA